MKYVLALLLCASLNASGVLIPKDKQQHIEAGVLISLTGSYLAKEAGFKHPKVWGFGLALGAGILKEVWDKQHPKNHTCDAKDALATALGGTLTFAIRW